MNRHLGTLVVIVLTVLGMAGCATTGPEVVGNFDQSFRLAADQYEEIVVSGFEYTTYRSTEQYVGSTSGGGVTYDYYNVLQEYGGGDVSSVIAELLNGIGIAARAAKDQSYEDLEPGEVLFSGEVFIYQIGTFEPWMVAPFFLGIGNIFPAPWGFKVGARVDYTAELVDAGGTILNQLPRKSAQALFNHYWIWGSLTGAEADFANASDIIGPQAVGEILSMFE